MEKTNKPIHQITLGAIRASIWKNENKGVVHFDTTFSRLYLAGNTWKSADSFGRNDLLSLAKVVDQAHSWICQQLPAAKPATPAGSKAWKPVLP
jgi:hypothetical protein